MRKLAIALLAIAAGPPSALGGVISFLPDKATVNPGVDPFVKFDVFIEQLDTGPTDFGGNSFGAFDVIFGSGRAGVDSAGLELVDFVFDASLAALTDSGFPPRVLHNKSGDIYLDDVRAGIFVNESQDTRTPYRIGSLLVDTTGLAEGQYEAIVDFDLDKTSFATGVGPQAGISPLYGTAVVNVVPEPGTLSLVGLASLALIRRRGRLLRIQSG